MMFSILHQKLNYFQLLHLYIVDGWNDVPGKTEDILMVTYFFKAFVSSFVMYMVKSDMTFFRYRHVRRKQIQIKENEQIEIDFLWIINVSLII